MTYRAPLADYALLLERILPFEAVCARPRFADCAPAMAQAMFEGIDRMAREVIAPLNPLGDRLGASMGADGVRAPDGFRAGYDALCAAGVAGVAGSVDHGGLGLPQSVAVGINEMVGSACLALQISMLMTQGQIEALEAHADPALAAIVVPKLASGEWAGTMNLTESQAGSDVGALTTRATDLGNGRYAITGQKIYISWGDHDLAQNICHLVLARLPDGPSGVRGISLFLVPKIRFDAGGALGAPNGVRAIGLEHKMGLHGSPTCVMEYDQAEAYLIGARHEGLAAMFTMMNNARLNVGGQGVAVAEAALQAATSYAQTRKQGQTPDIVGGTGAIIDHADLRRMLGGMRARVFAARALCLDLAVSLDLARDGADAAQAARAAFLTPIAKTYGTETGIFVANEAIQVFGGMGYIEETGVAQYLRDIRVSAIYEGTNGIQALDLVGRKLADGGQAARALITQIIETAQAAGDAGAGLLRAAQRLQEATEALIGQDRLDRAGGAAAYCMAFGHILGAHYHLRAATIDPARAPLAKVFMGRILPQAEALLAEAVIGSSDLYDLRLEDFNG